ncbi:hypothetical protein M0813_21811 [Anaeramoeba flamelloides]|uniref:RRM domain-containing protein n=1 Tax=Anaeramoeba flamelloides TaxID=1746091 RepID=A0ABQ8YFS4_9EUKA|nr:hypothetical protein M0813_21811 [Anaeramoeba flamelloides]
MSEYDEDYKKKKKNLFYSKKNKKENQNKKSNTSNNENRTKTNVQKNEKTLQNKHYKQSQSSNQKKKKNYQKKKEKNTKQEKKKEKKNTKNVKNAPKPRKKSRNNMEIDPPKHQNLNCQNNTQNEKKDHKRSKISTNRGSSINYEFLPNAIFMHNIPYTANYYDIESLLDSYVEIKELILLLDRFNRFKGSAKIILTNEEESKKILNFSGKLSIFNRIIFFHKFRNIKTGKINKTQAEKINNQKNTKRNQPTSSKQHKKNTKDIKNNEWFEKNFLNKNNDNNKNKNTNKNYKRKFSNNQIVIFNLPTNINKENIFKSFKII